MDIKELRYINLAKVIMDIFDTNNLIISMRDKLEYKGDNSKCYISIMSINENDEGLKTKYLDITDYNIRYNLNGELESVFNDNVDILNYIKNALLKNQGKDIYSKYTRKKYTIDFNLTDTVRLYSAYLNNMNSKAYIDLHKEDIADSNCRLSIGVHDTVKSVNIFSSDKETDGIIFDALAYVFTNQFEKLDNQLAAIHTIIANEYNKAVKENLGSDPEAGDYIAALNRLVIFSSVKESEETSDIKIDDSTKINIPPEDVEDINTLYNE